MKKNNKKLLFEMMHKVGGMPLNEGVWAKIMKGVRGSEYGAPYSIVVIENNKVVDQTIDIKIPDVIPAHYENIKKTHPNARIRIEDRGGVIVWDESD